MMTKTTISKALATLAFLAGPAFASDCRDVDFDGASFTVCTVATNEDLRLFLTDAEGNTHGSFSSVEQALAAEGKRLDFAMNAGMYHPDYTPVGLYIEHGTALAPLVTAEGPGNFGLLPNGVFCVEQGRFRVAESRAFAADAPACRMASQSGPMLVIDGALHPRFLPQSDSLYLRNGVGVSADGQTAVFAISNDPVNFHHFGRLFRDALDTPDALYFDGKISRLRAPSLGRQDIGWEAMGPIIGTVEPAP